MKRLLVCLVALFSLSVATNAAPPAFRTLKFLTNGHFQFDAGPELDLPGLQIEIKRMARAHDCPDVHLHPDSGANYAQIAAGLKLFQQYGCNDLGFRGIEGPN